MKIAIFTGPRVISAEDETLVRGVVREVIARGFQIYVGDATGVDYCVRKECFIKAREQNDEKFFANTFFPIQSLGRSAAGLAERSTRMVKDALRDADNDKIICIGFPNKPCPAGIIPARSWKSGAPGSGTWSTLALAVGNEIETWIVPLQSLGEGWHEKFIYDSYFMGGWSAWHFTPNASLFDQFPENAHDALANGWTEMAREGEAAEEVLAFDEAYERDREK